MKKILLIAMAAVAALAISCSPDTIEPEVPTVDVTPTPEPPKPQPEPTKYTIEVSSRSGGNATATVDGNPVTEAIEGTDVTITATPYNGFDFETWVTDGIELEVPTKSVQTFKMPSGEVFVEAVFKAKPEPKFVIAITSQAGGSATATIDGSLVTEAIEGAEVTITATPNEKFDFVGWVASGIALANSAEKVQTFKMPTGNVSIEAQFEAKPEPKPQSVEFSFRVPTPSTYKPIAEPNLIARATDENVMSDIHFYLFGPEKVYRKLTQYSTMPLELHILPGEYKVYAIANVNTVSQNTTEAVLQKLTFRRTDLSERLVMSYQGTMTVSADTKSKEIVMTRSAAKISYTIKIPDVPNNAFRILEVQLCNMPDKGAALESGQNSFKTNYLNDTAVVPSGQFVWTYSDSFCMP